MRIVAGTAGGRRFQAPPGKVRPTTERVREAIFSSLESQGVIVGARAADLFAGSGAMGLEALSRGAASVAFVDEDPLAVSTVKVNLASTGLEGAGAQLCCQEVSRYLRLDPQPLDLVFCDPPYGYGKWSELLSYLGDALVVAESERPLGRLEGWDTLRERRFGGTVVTVMRRSSPRTGESPQRAASGRFVSPRRSSPRTGESPQP